MQSLHRVKIPAEDTASVSLVKLLSNWIYDPITEFADYKVYFQRLECKLNNQAGSQTKRTFYPNLGIIYHTCVAFSLV